MIYNDNVEKERERERKNVFDVRVLACQVSTEICHKPKHLYQEALEHLARRENDEDCPGHGKCVPMKLRMACCCSVMNNEWTKPTGAKLHRGVSKLFNNMGIIVCHHVCMELYTKLSLCRNLQLIWFVNMHIHICICHASIMHLCLVLQALKCCMKLDCKQASMSIWRTVFGQSSSLRISCQLPAAWEVVFLGVTCHHRSKILLIKKQNLHQIRLQKN